MKRTTKKTSRKAQLRVVQRDDHSALLAHFAQCPELFAPMLSLIESGKQSIAAVMNQAGRALVELLLQLSASSIAGEKSPGRHSGEVLWHGSQSAVLLQLLIERYGHLTPATTARAKSGLLHLEPPLEQTHLSALCHRRINTPQNGRLNFPQFEAFSSARSD